MNIFTAVKYYSILHRRVCVKTSRRAQCKCKLLTGTYIHVPQTNRAAFKQYPVNPTCKLYSKEPEIREHFIAKCDLYDSVRERYI